MEELQAITSRFDPEHVGICMDVNHAMNRWREVPEMISVLAPRIRAFHINDYDGVDEMHWFPGHSRLARHHEADPRDRSRCSADL